MGLDPKQMGGRWPWRPSRCSVSYLAPVLSPLLAKQSLWAATMPKKLTSPCFFFIFFLLLFHRLLLLRNDQERRKSPNPWSGSEGKPEAEVCVAPLSPHPHGVTKNCKNKLWEAAAQTPPRCSEDSSSTSTFQPTEGAPGSSKDGISSRMGVERARRAGVISTSSPPAGTPGCGGAAEVTALEMSPWAATLLWCSSPHPGATSA